VKALVRRAYANERIGKSYSLSQAIEDHKKVLSLDPEHNSASQKAVTRLEVMLRKQQEKEKEEMLGNLLNLFFFLFYFISFLNRIFILLIMNTLSKITCTNIYIFFFF